MSPICVSLVAGRAARARAASSRAMAAGGQTLAPKPQPGSMRAAGAPGIWPCPRPACPRPSATRSSAMARASRPSKARRGTSGGEGSRSEVSSCGAGVVELWHARSAWKHLLMLSVAERCICPVWLWKVNNKKHEFEQEQPGGPYVPLPPSLRAGQPRSGPALCVTGKAYCACNANTGPV